MSCDRMDKNTPRIDGKSYLEMLISRTKSYSNNPINDGFTQRKKREWQGKKFTIKPGQFITSLKSIRENAGSGISIQNVRTALERFEKYEFLTSKSTNKK